MDNGLLIMRSDVSLDEALQQSIGELGRGQRWRFCTASTALIPAAMQSFVMYFVGLDPFKREWWHCLDPEDSTCQAALEASGHSACHLPVDTWDWTDRGRSIASEWGLVCGSAWKLHMASVAFFGGCLLGVGLFVSMSEHVGRKKVLGLSATLAGLSGLASAAAPAYWWYMGLRVCSGVAAASMTLAARALATEPIGPSWRGQAEVVTWLFSILGGLVMVLISFLVRQWRGVALLAALPCLLWPALLPSVYESPAWLLSAGRKGEAIAALAAIASSNKTHLPDTPLADSLAGRAEQKGLLTLLRQGRLRKRLLIMLAASACASQMYFGLGLSLQGMSGPVHLNQALAFAIEAAACSLVLLTMTRLGFRVTIACSMLQGGLACLLCALTKGALQRSWALAGRFGAASVLSLTQLYTAELLPSDVQHAAFLVTAQTAQVGAMAAPAMLMLTQIPSAAPVPFFAWGPTATAAGLLMWLLPSTMAANASDPTQDIGGASNRRPKIKWPWWPGIRHLFRKRGQSSHWTRLNDLDPDQE